MGDLETDEEAVVFTTSDADEAAAEARRRNAHAGSDKEGRTFFFDRDEGDGTFVVVRVVERRSPWWKAFVSALPGAGP